MVKVWCLPKETEEALKALHSKIVSSVVEFGDLGCQDERDMAVLFPNDLMSYGLGTDIVVEITLPRVFCQGIQRLAENVGAVIFAAYPKAQVHCFAHLLDPRSCGLWMSSLPAQETTTNTDARRAIPSLCPNCNASINLSTIGNACPHCGYRL